MLESWRFFYVKVERCREGHPIDEQGEGCSKSDQPDVQRVRFESRFRGSVLANVRVAVHCALA